MPANLVAVAVGGALGSIARYLVAVAITRAGMSPLPWATLLVNVAGSFLLALFLGVLLARGASEPMRLFATVGICGGFTTYSSFNQELLTFGDGRAVAYAAATLVLCIGAGLLGTIAARAFSAA